MLSQILYFFIYWTSIICMTICFLAAKDFYEKKKLEKIETDLKKKIEILFAFNKSLQLALQKLHKKNEILKSKIKSLKKFKAKNKKIKKK